MGTCKSSYPKHLPFSYIIAFHAIHLIIHHWVLFSFSFIHFFPCFHFSNLSLSFCHFILSTSYFKLHKAYSVKEMLYFILDTIWYQLVLSFHVICCEAFCLYCWIPFIWKQTSKQNMLSLTKIFNLKFTIFIFHNKCNYHVCYNVMREVSLRIIFAAKVRLFKAMN